MTRLEWLADQIRASRRYTEEFLEATDTDDWFRMPAEGVTHVAWQVGHLAMAQYRLALERIRGARPDDPGLISAGFLAAFGRNSIPDPDPAAYPPADEIRAVFDRVHARVSSELAGLSESALDEPVLVPHRICVTKADALAWCSRHEMVHAGQIALIRRLIGRPPVW